MKSGKLSLTLTLLFSVLGLVAEFAFAQSKIEDAAKFLGEWKYDSVQYEGKPFDVGDNATIVVQKNRWIIQRNGKSIATKWSINPNASPKALNQTVIVSDSKSFEMKSIYRFDSPDTLVLCEMDHPDKPRPKEFRSEKGDGQFLIVLKRRKSLITTKSIENRQRD